MKETKRLTTRAVAPMSALATTATFTIIVVAVAVSSFFSVGAQQGGTGDNKAIDLTGKWKSDGGDEVFISQNGQTVTAGYPVGAAGEVCPYGLRKDFYFKGSLSGNTLTGTMKRCTRDEKLVKACNLSDPYDAKIIETTVDQNTITGKYVPDYINYDNDYKTGNYINCVLQPGKGHPTGFELTRECGENDARRQHPRSSSDKCKPDHYKGCQDIAVANGAFQEYGLPAYLKGDFSDKTMEHLKEVLDPPLDTFRAHFCDNSSARERTDKLMDELDDLLCEGDFYKRLHLLHDIHGRLKALALDICGSRSPY